MNVTLFPPTSTNLVVGSSHCGKTFFIQHIVKNFDLFYQTRAHVDYESRKEEEEFGTIENDELNLVRVYVIHCNSKTPQWPAQGIIQPNMKLIQLDIDEYDMNLVAPNSIVVFDDVSALHESIKQTVNVGAHHIPLLSVFVVSQNIVANVHYELVKLCHRIIFCCNSRGSIDAAKLVIQRLISDKETRKQLTTILGFCESEQTKFLLEINNLATYPTPFYGFSHLEHIKSNDTSFPFCLAYPILPPAPEKKNSVALHQQSGMEQPYQTLALLQNKKSLPPNTLVVLPLESLDLRKKETETTKCTPENAWDSVTSIMNEDIDMAFKPAKWRDCKMLARSILTNPSLCLSRDGKFMWLKHQYPPHKVNVLNFIKDVTRPVAPNESNRHWRRYKPIVAVLLAKGTPVYLIRNRLVSKK